MKIKLKRALISVSDKTGIVDFAKALHQHNVEIISTGGTANALQQAGIPVRTVSSITDFPEIMQGRVKSLHPKIHGAILGRRDQHAAEAQQHAIEWIDLVVCNLYPFAKTIAGNADFATAIENIDIGGPSMLRSAAKNMDWVCVTHDPQDYSTIIDHLEQGLDFELRKRLAAKAFAHTAEYDSLIANYLSEEDFPQNLTLAYHKHSDLRYGENPHQQAAVYRRALVEHPHLLSAKQHQGKALSYNNLNDGVSALNCVMEFELPACVVVKHANPCGVATATDIKSAFDRAWQADSLSAFGGIVALNRPCTAAIATFLSSVFIELVIAPGFESDALNTLAKKPNCRVLDTRSSNVDYSQWQYRALPDGLLVQQTDRTMLDPSMLKVVTATKPDSATLEQMTFAWQVLKYVKSNGIVITRNNTTLGIGAGQVSRIDAVKLAIEKSPHNLAGALLASDAFFPFADSINHIAKTDIKAIIQPGGSMRDQEVIDACNQHGIAMVFTGMRCFNH